MKKTRRTLAVVALVALTVGGPVNSQFENVGIIDFPTSATGEAQQHFLRGMAILHSFGWKQAIEQFHAAQAIDPDFAMAYWGENALLQSPAAARGQRRVAAGSTCAAWSHFGRTLGQGPHREGKGFA